jgi:anti-sigma factor RsiW
MRQNDTRKGQAHLRLEEIVSYIDQALSAGTRRRVERHLAECDACLREVIEVTRLVHSRV